MVEDALETKARELCKADGKDPDGDWRLSDNWLMLDVADDQPENWRRYIAAAKAALAQGHPLP